MNNTDPFSERMTAERFRLRLSRKGMARLLDLHWQTIFGYERGKFAPTLVNQAAFLAKTSALRHDSPEIVAVRKTKPVAPVTAETEAAGF